MSSTPAVHRPRVLTDAIPGDRVRDALLIVGFAIAIAAAAQLRVFLPGTTIPVTGQTFAILAGAIALGGTRATAGSLLYLAVGVAGVPWFAVSGGSSVGYLVGFVLASAVIGAIAQRWGSRSPVKVAAAMAVGNVVIWVCGVLGLMVVLGIGLGAAISAGVVPFLLGDAVKLALAVAIVPTLWRLVDRDEAR